MSTEIVYTTSSAESRVRRGEPPQVSRWGRILLDQLAKLQHGQVQIELGAGGGHLLGHPADDRLVGQVRIHHPRAFRSIVLGGGLGAAESYLMGDWSSPDLVSLMRVFCRNLDRFEQLDRGLARIRIELARWTHWLRSNTTSGSRRNISAHYDLSNDFFQLFLDPTLMYSSGLFETPEMTLEQASVQKLERICRKLELGPQDHVLEIGTGWGGCALHMARNYGCRVTTTTISEQQYLLAKERVAAAGLSERITVLLADYRSLTGQYDKIVSIEMLEAVGEEFLPVYFRTCHRLLNPGGRLLVQVITMPDHRYDVYRSSVDFIQKYIFPGGHLPSIGAMQQAIGKTANLQLTDAFQFPESYAQTLWHWRHKFWERIEQVRALGFDERFIRMWDYYFAYCEAAFRERAVSVGQFLWERARY